MKIAFNIGSYLVNCILQIGSHLVLVVDEGEVGRMVLVDANRKELGVAWMMEVLRVWVEAEVEVDLEERLAEAEVNFYKKNIYIT